MGNSHQIDEGEGGVREGQGEGVVREGQGEGGAG